MRVNSDVLKIGVNVLGGGDLMQPSSNQCTKVGKVAASRFLSGLG